MGGAASHPNDQPPLLRYIPLITVILVLLIAFGLRMWHLNTESIWHDEAWSIRAFRGPFTTPDDNTPYLYYLTGHLLWRLGGGETPLALRYVSVLMGTLTVALAWRVGRVWYGLGVCVAFAFLVGISPLLWEYSQEVRAYVAVPLFALAMFIGAEAILRHAPGMKIPRRVWAFVFCTELAALYTHNLAVPLVVWLNMALGGVWLLRREWVRMVVWSGIQITLIVAYIPWLLTQSPSGTPLNTPPEPGFALARDIWYSYFLPVLPQVQAVENPVLLNVLLGVLIVAMVVVVLRELPYQAWLLVSQVVFVPALSTGLMLVANIDFHPRYYIAAVPVTLLVLVIGVWQIGLMIEPTQLRVKLGKARFARTLIKLGVWGGLLAVMTVVSVQSLQDIRATREYQHDDFRGLAEYYATLPENAVILIPFDVERALQDYFDVVMDIPAAFVNVPLYSGEATALATIESLVEDNTPRHVEFLTWFQLPADARGMYPCLLSAFNAPTHKPETRNFFGLSTQAYLLDAVAAFQPIAPQVIAPQVTAAQPTYEEITLQGAGYVTNGQTTCVRTEWALNQPINENANVAAALLNPFDEPLTRADAEIARPDNVGTARWAAHDVGQAYTLLQLPPGAPPMAYDLTLNVYTATQDSGFDLLDAAGNPAGKTYVIGNAIETGGEAAVFTQTLIYADNLDDSQTIETGTPLDLTLAIAETEPLPTEITLAGGTWQETQSADGSGLSWHRFIVPPGNSGDFTLMVNGEALAQYTVVDVPRVFELPDFETEVDISFPDVGTLAGVTAPNTLSTDEIPEVTLIWRAEGDIDAAYTVFVQLLSDEGVVLAQSDSQPVQGTRPTTSWVADEYIVDVHTLRFNDNGRAYTGEATLIAGFYDAQNGFQRVLTDEGMDFARLSFDIIVSD